MNTQFHTIDKAFTTLIYDCKMYQQLDSCIIIGRDMEEIVR